MNRSRIVKIILVVLSLIFLLCVAASASDDFQYWCASSAEIGNKNEGTPSFQSFYLGDEFFYDCDKNAWNENWPTPAGFKIRLCEKSVAQLFYVIQSKKGGEAWSSNQVVGTHFIFSF